MKLSIITVNKDNCNGLRRTIESVLNQKGAKSECEYIVVDGASTDGSVKCINKYSSRIDKWISEKDDGIYQAMNKGIRLSKGDYCLFLNSGDYLHDENVLEEMIPHLMGFDIIVGKMQFLDSGQEMSVPGEISLLSFYRGSLPHPATFISRKVLEKHPYDEKYRIASDWKFWIESLILDKATIKSIGTMVSCFDCTGISSKNRKMSDVERDMILQELIPSRILIDYTHFIKGSGYQETEYDRFYIQMRDTRYGKVLFALNKVVMRIAALFFRSARFANHILS